MEAGGSIAPRPRHPRLPAGAITLALLAAVLAGIAAGAGLSSTSGTRAAAARAGSGAQLRGQATWAPGALAAPAIAMLRDQDGRRFSLAALRGRTVAMTFFDSHCTQACPLAGRAFAAAEQALPGGLRPVLVVVSVNPRDTPASTRLAARRWGLAHVAPWHWLRGTPAQLGRVWKAYHIFVAPPRDGDISHTEALYLIDRRGFERSGYLYPFVPAFVAHDLRTLGAEPGRGAG